ncbi:MAG: RteC domain-containing protein [Lutibacter sp.]|nr:RteC domain-containing protein [Lutibacter sp.]
MKKIATIIDNFDLAITDVKKLNISKLGKVEKSIKIARDCLYELRLEMRNMESISPRDEIHFFKMQKPRIHGRLFFYLELNNFLINYPETGISEQRIYIKEHIAILKSKKADVFEFAKYCRLNATKYDHMYFLREDPQLDLFMIRNLEDPEFSTSHDKLASEIVTFNLLMKFYASELELLNPKKENVVIEVVKPLKVVKPPLEWKGSNTDLIEFIYGLDARGAVGESGPENVKKMVKFSERAFGVKLGNYQKTYCEIKARNKDLTKFLNSLVVALIAKIKSEQK